MLETSEIIDSAISYREDGIQVFPVPYGTKKAEIDHKKFQSEWIPINHLPKLFINSNIAGLGGSISNNLIILDVDNFEKFHKTIAQDKWFKDIRMSTWESFSASGKPHIYLRTAYPVRGTNQVKTVGTEIRGNGLYALMPPSIYLKNGQGLLYTWARKSGSILQLNESETEKLKELIPFKKWEPNISNDKPFGMSWKFFDILCNGNFHKYGFTQSRSEGEFQILLHLINLGWNNNDILSLIDERASNETRFKTRNKQHTIDELLRARQWSEAHKSEIIKTIEEIQQSIPYTNWNLVGGKSALTDRLVFEYFLSVAKRSHKIEDLGLSEREIAEGIGRCRIAVHRSIQRLIESGKINKTTSTDKFNPTIYSIKKTTKRTTLTQDGQEKEWFFMSHSVSHDSWRKSKSNRVSALKTGFAVYETIKNSSGITTKEIFTLLSQFMTLRTVQRKIKHLEQLGAIVSEEKGWRVSSMELDEIAHRIDSKGQAEKQKRFHKEEREFRKRLLTLPEEDRVGETKKFYYNKNKNLRRLSPTEWVNPKTGEIFSI